MIYLATVLFVLGVFSFSFGYAATKCSFPDKTKLWNSTIKADSSIKKMRSALIFGLVVVAIGFILWIYAMVNDNDVDFLAVFVLPTTAMLVPIPFGMISGEKQTIKTIETNKNCLEIGAFEPIKKADANISKSKTIEIFCDGIVLMDTTNYAFEKIIFSDYALGNLDGAKQMIAISCYFLQKYPNVFKRKYNQNLSTVGMTGDSLTDVTASAANIAASASGQGIISVRLIKKND